MKKKVILIVSGVFAFFLVTFLGMFIYYNISLGPVQKDNAEVIVFTVSKGESTYQIIENLKEQDLIKDSTMMKIYAKLEGGSLLAGNYTLSKGMTSKEIYNKMVKGDVTHETVWVTFVEGKRLSYFVSQIAKNFDYTEDEINVVLEDKTYLNELINNYDMLTTDILGDKIYHPLEGYLFPDTYQFITNASIKEIIEKLLDTMQNKLNAYEEDIKNSNMSVHELMTLASIVELEGARSDDRAGVAGVFYNRLATNTSLGSDVTTYYAVNKDFSVDLTKSDLNSCNGYNTRGSCVSGLPVGPIASPSIESLKATLEPEKNDYYYFVSDKNGKTYFSKTYSEFEKSIKDLRASGMWYEY